MTDEEVTYTNQTRTTGSKCPVCHFLVRARKDGTIGSHHIWTGKKYLGRCPGTGRLPNDS